jgi:hypothetical protein
MLRHSYRLLNSPCFICYNKVVISSKLCSLYVAERYLIDTYCFRSALNLHFLCFLSIWIECLVQVAEMLAYVLKEDCHEGNKTVLKIIRFLFLARLIATSLSEKFSLVYAILND